MLFWSLFCLLLGSLVSAQEFITIDYTAENTITLDEQMFRAHITLNTEPKPFIELMDAAAQLDSRFRYTTVEHERLGHYVSSINGVYEDPARQMSWVLLKKTNEGNCILNVGISTYIPYDGEHMVYQLETWDIYEQLPTCPDE